MTNCPVCPRCSLEEESTLHVMRDCFIARRLWNTLVPQSDAAEFYSMELQEWINHLLKRCSQGGREQRTPEWMFMACWMQWKWQNEEVFKGNRLEIQQQLRILHGLFEENDALQRVEELKKLDPSRALEQTADVV